MTPPSHSASLSAVSRRARADATLTADFGRTRLRYRTGKLVFLTKGDEPPRECRIDLPLVRLGSDESNFIAIDDPHVKKLVEGQAR